MKNTGLKRMAEAPREVRLNPAKDLLNVVWNDREVSLRAEYLRVESPSAEVKGHGVGQARLVSGKAAVTIKSLEAVGAYALRITFSDGHNTGLYTWDYLGELAAQEAERWQTYLTDLERARLSRDKAGPVVLRRELA